MKLHEYQAKEILQSLGIRIPGQVLATTPEEAAEAFGSFPGGCVIKAQVHSGGRGKAGGVKVCDSREEAFACASELLGKRLCTAQTGEDGLFVPAVLLTEKLAIDSELYLAVAVDTNRLGYSVIASASGGMEIEDVARTAPDQIVRVFVPCDADIKPYHVQYLSDRLGLRPGPAGQLKSLLVSALAYLKQNDASLIEINPLAVSGEDLIAADAKITFDDNALFRHEAIRNMEDLTQIEELERKARGIGLSYVRLKGNIACLVNGAGLAMATMDIIKSYGGEPADFMDVGGGVGVEKVTAAFELIMEDPNVDAIFVNIFGGIAQCDVIAEGIVQATEKTGLSIPLVVRLRGTNEEKGKDILNRSGLDIISVEDFSEAVKTVISCAAGR